MAARHLADGLNAALEDPGCRAAPPGVEQSDGSAGVMHEVDGNAVGNGDSQEQAFEPRDVAIHPISQEHPSDPFGVIPQINAMALMAQDHPSKPRADRRAKRPPSCHDATDRAFAPQTQVKPTLAAGQAGDDSILPAPRF